LRYELKEVSATREDEPLGEIRAERGFDEHSPCGIAGAASTPPPSGASARRRTGRSGSIVQEEGISEREDADRSVATPLGL